MAPKENDFVEFFAEKKRIREKFQGEAQKMLQQQIFIVILYEFPAIIFYVHTFAIKTQHYTGGIKSTTNIRKCVWILFLIF